MNKTNKTDDGGPATEMSLRDWFAGMVIQGIYVRDGFEEGMEVKLRIGGEVNDARIAYLYADAMLAARSK